MAALCSKYEVHPTQAGLWKQRLLKGAHELFGEKSSVRTIEEQQKLIEELYGQIGKLTHEVTWLKKGCDEHSLSVRRGWIDAKDPHLSIARQCELAGVSHSGWYYEPMTHNTKDELEVMQQIDEIFTACPMYGSPRITAELKRRGLVVNHKRVERLMRDMGIEALYPKLKTSIGNVQDKRFPYLLKGLTVSYPNHVWGTDFTFIRIGGRWHYLIAYLDWFSRYVVVWDLCEAATGRGGRCDTKQSASGCNA